MLNKILIMVVILVGAFLLFLTVPSWLSSGKETVKMTNETDLIEIDVSGISTTIIPEKRDDVEAKLDGKGNVSVDQRGSRIEIEYKRNWLHSFSFFKRPKLTIYLPEDYDRDLAIEIGSGNLNYKGQSNKPIQINNLELDVSSGSVNMDSITAHSGVFNISSGNVNVKHYTGRLEADVSSGKINIQMDELTDSIAVDVSSGYVELDLPNKADFILDGKVSSGSISSNFVLKNKEENKQVLKGVHGTGEHQVDLSVSSGKIEVN
jgi:lia operon protein LiaG